MARPSAGFTALSTLILSLAVHIFYIMPYVSGILIDVPPQPYRSWEFLNQAMNYFFIALWAVSIPLILILLSEWIYDTFGRKVG